MLRVFSIARLKGKTEVSLKKERLPYNTYNYSYRLLRIL